MSRSPNIRLNPTAGVLWAVIAAGLILTGCQAVGFLAQGVVGEQIEAVHQLQDRPTLILVDDPDQVLGDASLAMRVAAQAGHDLVQEKILQPTNLIETKRIEEIRRGLNERQFAKIPASQIGQRLEAQQVILVHVESSQLTSEPNVLRPIARSQVKVIDCQNQKRLFPAPSGSAAAGIAPLGGDTGHVVETRLTYRVNSDEYKNLTPIIRRAIATQIGKQVAMLFYDHEPVKMTPQALPTDTPP